MFSHSCPGHLPIGYCNVLYMGLSLKNIWKFRWCRVWPYGPYWVPKGGHILYNPLAPWTALDTNFLLGQIQVSVITYKVSNYLQNWVPPPPSHQPVSLNQVEKIHCRLCQSKNFDWWGLGREPSCPRFIEHPIPRSEESTPPPPVSCSLEWGAQKTIQLWC